MNIYTCPTCAKDFKTERSLRSHLNWHKPGYAEKSIAGAKLSIDSRVRYHLNGRSNRVAEYENNPSRCIGCDSVLPYDKRFNKFCNHSCSCSHHNQYRSAVSINKQRNSLLKTNSEKKIYNHPKKPKVIKECVICFTRHIGAGKTCSATCKHKLNSMSMKAAIRTGKHNPRVNRGRHKRSYLETSFEEWLIEHGVTEYIPEYKINRYDDTGKYEKTYYIDFYFPKLQLGIELDGTQHKLTVEKDIARDQYLSRLNVEILRITHAEYIIGTKIELVRAKLGI